MSYFFKDHRHPVCPGKQRYETMGDAHRSLRALKNKRQRASDMHPFRCKPCGGFHLGRPARGRG